MLAPSVGRRHARPPRGLPPAKDRAIPQREKLPPKPAKTRRFNAKKGGCLAQWEQPSHFPPPISQFFPSRHAPFAYQSPAPSLASHQIRFAKKPFLRLLQPQILTSVPLTPFLHFFSKCCNNHYPLPSLVPTSKRREAITQSAAAAVYEHEVVTQPTEFSRIFEAHHGMIFRTAYRITGNAADAEDVLQTIFLRLLRQPVGSAALDQEESYLRRAAVNASLDIIRQKQASRSVPLNEAATQSSTGPTAENALQDCLRRALRTLTDRSAEIFALRYFEDLTNPQIASALDISQVLVAVSLHRARRQLQKEIRTCMGGQQ